MTETYLEQLKPERFPSPGFVVDEAKLRSNVAILDEVQRRTGAKILMALKCFAMWDVFPIISRSGEGALYGCCASSPDEARLARECFGGEVHAFAAGYSEADMVELLETVDHVLFNSFAQWERFKGMVEAKNAGRATPIECGIRVNPEHSEGAVPMYDPCAPGSRLGVRLREFERFASAGGCPAQTPPPGLKGLSGLHFHTLCEQGADALDRTLKAFEMKFGRYLKGLKWMNFGGGHHITKEGYDIDLLCKCIERVRDRYGVQVYLEPGEAVALNAGVLVSTVLDVVRADMPVAILDTSAATHMPDVLEMPYRPMVIGSGEAGEKKWSCRLAGKSCLAGDVIGEYSFDAPLKAGDRLVFTDMAIYSMVKTTTFNGLRSPSIVLEPGNRRDAACPGIRLRRFQDAVVLMSKEKLSYAQQVCVKSAGKAMQRTGMVGPGAKVGVAVSGGVDSWVLLEVLRRRQRIVPFRFDIMAIHLNPGFDAENHAPLVEYLAKHGVAGHIEVTDHGPRGHSPENRRNSACFYCAMLRRTRLFEVCQRYGLTHLAFGHNADDLVTTFFMNLVQNGRVEGMGMCDDFFKGALKVIRPLLLVEKPDIIKAARRWELPVWSNPCPSAGKTNRANFQAKIDALHGGDKMLKTNLFNGLCRWQLAQSESGNKA